MCCGVLYVLVFALIVGQTSKTATTSEGFPARLPVVGVGMLTLHRVSEPATVPR